ERDVPAAALPRVGGAPGVRVRWGRPHRDGHRGRAARDRGESEQHDGRDRWSIPAVVTSWWWWRVCVRGSRRVPARGLVLARPAPAPLARDDAAVDEDLAAPDAPGLTALERTGEARRLERAVDAERLGPLDVVAALGEPEVEVVGVLAGQRQVGLGGRGRRRPARRGPGGGVEK